MTLTEFLLARIAEDEAIARAAGIPAHDGYKPHGELMTWRYADEGEVEFDYDDPHPYPDKYYVTCDREGILPSVDAAQGQHIARHDPARVLAECEVKRRIIEAWTRPTGTERRPTERPGISDVVTLREPWLEMDGDVLLALLALPYVDHPDYRDEWRP